MSLCVYRKEKTIQVVFIFSIQRFGLIYPIFPTVRKLNKYYIC